jgi:hypothetical protein
VEGMYERGRRGRRCEGGKRMMEGMKGVCGWL